MSRQIKTRISSVFLLLAVLLLPGGPVSAAEFYLRAGTNQLTMPDNAVVTIWGFALDADNDFSTVDGIVTSPGPMLTVPPGDNVLTIHLHNDLAEPVSLTIAGQITDMAPVFFTDGQGRQRVQSFTDEAAPGGGEFTYTWNNFKAGSYLYQSGTHPAIQVQMGLFGGVKKDTAGGQAYPGNSYSQEGILIFSEIDPVIHAAVAGGTYGPGLAVTSPINYHPKYFLFNGQAQIILSGVLPSLVAGQNVLIRMLNAGLITRMPELLGASMTVLAEDGNARTYQTEARNSLAVYAGKTMDVMVATPAAGTLMALFDRRGYVSQGAAGGGGTPTQQVISGLPVPPATGSTTVAASSGGGGGGGGGGAGCFINLLYGR